MANIYYTFVSNVQLIEAEKMLRENLELLAKYSFIKNGLIELIKSNIESQLLEIQKEKDHRNNSIEI
jgi:hypothetical protein